MQPEQLPPVPKNHPQQNSSGQINAGYTSPSTSPPKQRSHIVRYLQERRIFLLVTLLIVLPLLFAFIVYKYDILGVVKKQNYSIEIVDRQTFQPLSNATVTMRGQTVKTDSSGRATFSPIKIGDAILSISHPYYKNFTTATLITFTNHNYHVFGLANVGKEISVFVKNRVTQQLVSGAVISSQQNSVTTNAKGHAWINLPTNLGQTKFIGKIVTPGYNDSDVTIDSQAINAYTIDPYGKVYYLQKTTSNVALIQSNIDGTSPKPVLNGSPAATSSNSQVLSSYDSNYVAVVMPDATNIPTLYVYNTLKDSVVNVSKSSLGLTLNGWTPDNHLIYTLLANGIPNNTGTASRLYAYNAAGKANAYILDPASQGGFDSFSYAQENFNPVIVLNDNNVVFSKYWSGSSVIVNSSSTSLTSILAQTNLPTEPPNPIKTLNYSNSYSTPPKIVMTSPTSLDIAYSNSSNNKNTYYTFSSGKVADSSAAAIADTIANPPISSSYYLSPSGQNQMWSHVDSDTTIIYVGDKNGINPKAVATFNNNLFTPYGWWTNDYLLLTKDNNTLYVMPANGTNNETKVQPVANFLP